MARILELAIDAQDAAGVAVVAGIGEHVERRRRHAVSLSRPIGLRLLAWCDRHANLAAPHRQLIERLRDAMARGERIADLVTEIYSEIPDAMEAQA